MKNPLCRSLYGKIATVLFFLLVAVAVINIMLTLYTTLQHMRETTQRIHRDLAEYLVSSNLFINEGIANKTALMKQFETLMHINPKIELYLLDPKGNILAYSAPPGHVKRERVSIEPIRTFLGSSGSLPVLGDDPRDTSGNKVFSAAPVAPDGKLEGYLYIILTGEEYDSAASMLKTSYILRLGTWVTLLSLLFVFAAGLFLFYLLTRRISKLADTMESFPKDGISGTTVPVPVHGGNDEIDRLAMSFQKMSERITGLVHNLKLSDLKRRELITNVSHDLRTPLASMQGYLETLRLKKDELEEPERQECVNIALKHASRLNSLIIELFELSKLDSGERKPEPEPFNLGDLVSDIVQKNALMANERFVYLTADYPEDLPLVVADIGLIERVIQNLVDNGLRHTPADGTVTMRLSTEPPEIRVAVADTGQGIPPEHLSNIFERAYRIQRETGEPGSSSGLGLSIAKRILELHGREITVKSSPESGTVFSFTLPRYNEPY